MSDHYGNFPNWDKFTNEQKLMAEVHSSRLIVSMIDECDVDNLTGDDAKRFINQLKYELYLDRIDPADYVIVDENFLEAQNICNAQDA